MSDDARHIIGALCSGAILYVLASVVGSLAFRYDRILPAIYVAFLVTAVVVVVFGALWGLGVIA